MDIYRYLLLGENDFQAVLRENFPDLGTHLMRKSEWTKIRRLMGKPRRFVNNKLRPVNRKVEKLKLLLLTLSS